MSIMLISYFIFDSKILCFGKIMFYLLFVFLLIKVILILLFFIIFFLDYIIEKNEKRDNKMMCLYIVSF